jgi:hypothetical protein
MRQESSVLYRLSPAGQWVIQDMIRIAQHDEEFVRAFAQIDNALVEKNDERDFAMAKSGSLSRVENPLLRQRESLVAYLVTYPAGKHTSEATLLLREVESQIQSQQDQTNARDARIIAECQQVLSCYVQLIQKGDFNGAMVMASDMTCATAIFQARGEYEKQGKRVTLPTITSVKVYLEHSQDIRATLTSERHGDIPMQKRPGSDRAQQCVESCASDFGTLTATMRWYHLRI